MKDVENDENYTFERWLKSYQQSATRKVYGTAVGSFLRSIYQTDEKTEALAPRYIKEVKAGKRNCTHDLGDFITFTQSGRARKNGKPLPPNTTKLYMAATYGFLSQCCGVDISIPARRMLRGKMPKGNRARTAEADLDREKLRKIFLHCDVRLKALVLLLLSSGIRIGEALQLKLDDVTLEAVPPVVHVRAECAKEKDQYTSFISSEAKEALQEWLKVREDFIRDSAYRVHNVEHRTYRPWQQQPKLPEENTIFPISYNAAGRSFGRALKRAGLHVKDKETGIHSVHIHMLRKYFLSQAKTKMPSEIAETLVGHATYLSDSYRRYTTAQLGEFYRKAESALLILQDTTQLETLNGEVNKKDAQIADLIAYNMQLQAKLANHEARIERWEAFTQRFMVMSNDRLTEIGNQVAAARVEQEITELDKEPLSLVKEVVLPKP